MATSGFRISYEWQQQASVATGWTENFWNAAPSYAQAFAQAGQLKVKLNAIHGAQAFCPYIRISYWPKGRKLAGVNFPSAGPGILTADNDADFPTTALLINLEETGGAITRQWIKGLPDNQVANAGRYAAAGTYPAELNAFFLELKSATKNWSIRVLGGGAAPASFTRVDSTTGLITATAHGFPVGEVIYARVSGIKNYDFATGLQYLYVASADTLQYQIWPGTAPTAIQVQKGQIRNQVWTLEKITFAEVNRITKRNVGRPTRALSGSNKQGKKK